MPLSDVDKERVRYHMGYLAVSTAASIQYGIPRPLQTLFLLETAMTNLIESSIPRVRGICDTLDTIEQTMVQAISRLKADTLKDLKLRQNETQLLEQEYDRWSGRLSDMMGAPRYPYSARFKGTGAASNGRGGSIPVTG